MRTLRNRGCVDLVLLHNNRYNDNYEVVIRILGNESTSDYGEDFKNLI